MAKAHETGPCGPPPGGSLQMRTFAWPDYDAVKALWAETGLTLRAADAPEELARMLERNPDLFLVALHGERIVATLLGGWDGRRGWLYHLAVAPTARRQGIAQRLVAAMESLMAAKGATEVFGIVYSDNVASLALGEHMGYAVHPEMRVVGKRIQ